MVNKSVAIIGVGSLGGFLAESVSAVDCIKRLTILDYDDVEPKNVRNSIYTMRDVGQFKVDVIADKIHERLEGLNKSLKIVKRCVKYTNDMDLSDHDIVFDCRDVVCSRDRDIDVRLYISFSKLVVDCRPSVEVKNERPGRYIESLSKVMIAMGAARVATLIPNGDLERLIARGIPHEIDLNDTCDDVESCLQREEEKPDYICDMMEGHQKIANLDNVLPQVIEATAKDDVQVCVGTKRASYVENILRQSPYADQRYVIHHLTEMINNLALAYDSYTVSLRYDSRTGKATLELSPDSGGA